jgi:hypothetical protein
MIVPAVPLFELYTQPNQPIQQHPHQPLSSGSLLLLSAAPRSILALCFRVKHSSCMRILFFAASAYASSGSDVTLYTTGGLVSLLLGAPLLAAGLCVAWLSDGSPTSGFEASFLNDSAAAPLLSFPHTVMMTPPLPWSSPATARSTMVVCARLRHPLYTESARMHPFKRNPYLSHRLHTVG